MKYFFEAGVGNIPAFSMAGTAVKASGTDAQDVRWTSALRGPEWSGDFPNKQKIAFVSRKPCLQKSGF